MTPSPSLRNPSLNLLPLSLYVTVTVKSNTQSDCTHSAAQDDILLYADAMDVYIHFLTGRRHGRKCIYTLLGVKELKRKFGYI